MKKLLTGLAGLILAVGGLEPVKAAVIVLEPTAGPLSIYDTGGLLNSPPGLDCTPGNLPNIPTDRPFYMGGLEVAPDGSGVFVTQSNNLPCNDFFDHPSTLNRLIKSTGLGTASQVGPILEAGNNGTWGNDLTLGPEGLYYIATNKGVWGFDPAGGSPRQFAGGETIWTASGLTFTPDGNTAIISSDWPKGLWSVPKGGSINNLQALIPVIPREAWDDHVVTRDGKLLMMGDNASELIEVLPDGRLQDVFRFRDYIDVRSYFRGNSYGSRGTVDPITGDIFYAVSFESPSSSIIRIKSDFSGAIPFATGFAEDLRDLDFGPSSSGRLGEISLYVSENNRATGVGTIYEIGVGSTAVPEPSETILGSIMVLGFGVLFKRKLSKKQKKLKKKS
ncbi:PEP-CTERM sorting domain-containing protein [Microseira sp. BLCC-F43]|jgi:hypothetical protein|uniref:PEP-CTERM sorting domain-containing protein n=1 Tax=Microseira sp. BLCC-F43 TaxID=3153602 RepID=UPI0035B8DC2F